MWAGWNVRRPPRGNLSAKIELFEVCFEGSARNLPRGHSGCMLYKSMVYNMLRSCFDRQACREIVAPEEFRRTELHEHSSGRVESWPANCELLQHETQCLESQWKSPIHCATFRFRDYNEELNPDQLALARN